MFLGHSNNYNGRKVSVLKSCVPPVDSHWFRTCSRRTEDSGVGLVGVSQTSTTHTPVKQNSQHLSRNGCGSRLGALVQVLTLTGERWLSVVPVPVPDCKGPSVKTSLSIKLRTSYSLGSHLTGLVRIIRRGLEESNRHLDSHPTPTPLASVRSSSTGVVSVKRVESI